MSGEITLRHSDERLIEVLANINPHLAPYTAALGKEAADKIIFLQTCLCLEIAHSLYHDRDTVADMMISKQSMLNDETPADLLSTGRGDQVIRLLRQIKESVYV